MSSASIAQGRWNLKDILPAASGAGFNTVVADLQNRVALFESQRAKLSADIESKSFLEILKHYESIVVTHRRLGAYAELWFCEDTQSSEALSFQRQMRQLLADLDNRTLFFSLWWKSLDDASVERLKKSANADYRYFLDSVRRFKPYTLSEAEEQIVNLKDVNGIEGLVTIYDMLTNRFQFSVSVDGRKRKMTRGELQALTSDASPARREAAYRELLCVFGEQGTALAQIYAYRVQDWAAEQVRLRHFSSPIAARNLMNDIPDAVIETLLDVCRANTAIFQRFFTSKAKWLGMKKLRRYDIYAPLARSKKKYTYSRAVEMVLDSYDAFSPQVGNLARQVLEEQHVDSEIRKGKQSGAFCMTVLPNITPYVLLNYTQRARDVSTMAHEFGHAIHSMLANQHSALTQHPPLPLAETASVFGEMMMADRMLKEEKDQGVRRELLAAKLDDTYATVMRQAFFILFEQQAHALIADGKTVDDLCAAYLENLREQFGDAVEVSEDFKWEWITIPHIYHTPFYTYAYSFGNLLTLALYKQYLAQNDAFKPRYLKILSCGGSASPVQILSDAGIDIHSKEFWQGGFDVIKDWLEELESLPATDAKRAATKNTRPKKSHTTALV